MKYKIIDWVGGWDTFPPEGELTFAKRNYLVDEIRRNGYLFPGEAHQEEAFCVPVFNDGTRYETTRRGWGRIMADAYERYGLYDYSFYTEFFSVSRSDCIYPDPQEITATDEDWATFEANNYEDPDPFEMATERYNKLMEAAKKGEGLYPGASRREELAERYDLTAESKAQYDDFCRAKPLVYTVPENSEFCLSLRYLDKGDAIRMTFGDLFATKTVTEVDYRKIYTDEDAAAYKTTYATDVKKANDTWLSLPIRITITLK